MFFVLESSTFKFNIMQFQNILKNNEIMVKFISMNCMLAADLTKELDCVKFEQMIEELSLTNWLIYDDAEKYIEFFLCFCISFFCRSHSVQMLEAIEWEKVFILLIFTRCCVELSLGAVQFDYALGFICWSGLCRPGKCQLAVEYRTFVCMGLVYI